MAHGIAIKSSKQQKLKRLGVIFESLGDTFSYVELKDIAKVEFDFFFQHGIKKPTRNNNEFYETLEQHEKPVLIREAAPIRELEIKNTAGKTPIEDQWMRLSWNSFYMDDGIHPFDPSYSRWNELKKEYNLQVEDWKRRGDNIIFNLQKTADSALNRLYYNDIDYKFFVIEKINEIQKYTDRPIIIRPHPKDLKLLEWLKEQNLNVTFSDMRPFKEDLDRAWCLITYNSTTCVESTLYGTPTCVLDPSAVSWEVSQQSIAEIENDHDVDRDSWLEKIAFMQWKGSEFKNGYAWKLLKDSINL